MTGSAVIYARRQAATHPQAMNEQIRACHQMAEREGLRVLRTFHDVGSANAPLPLRPGLQALLTDAEDHKFGTVMVEDLERLSRDMVTRAVLLGRLRSFGISVLTVSDEVNCCIDFSGLVDRIFREYAEGRSTRKIAKRLNAEAVRQ